MFKNLKKRLKYITLSTIICASSCSVLPNNYKPIHNIKPDYVKKIEEIDSVWKAMDYCSNLEYCEDEEQYGKECWVSFKKIYNSGKDDCDGGAVAAAALLSDDGYIPTILCMYGGGYGHAVFLYEKDGKYGSIGINYCDCNFAKFDTVDDLVRYLDEILHTNKEMEVKRNLIKEYKYYYILDFSKWIDSLTHADEFLDPIVSYVKKESEKHYLE